MSRKIKVKSYDTEITWIAYKNVNFSGRKIGLYELNTGHIFASQIIESEICYWEVRNSNGHYNLEYNYNEDLNNGHLINRTIQI